MATSKGEGTITIEVTQLNQKVATTIAVVAIDKVEGDPWEGVINTSSTAMRLRPSVGARRNTLSKGDKVKVYGEYNNFWYVKTERAAAYGETWVFVDKDKVEEWEEPEPMADSKIRSPNSFFIWPLGYRWRFGRGWQVDPTTGRGHNGLDINRTSRTDSNDSSKHVNGNPYNQDIDGAVVYAAAAGTVRLADDGNKDNIPPTPSTDNEGRGNYVQLVHTFGSDTYRTGYQHLQKGSVDEFGLKVGDTVKKGQPIGRVGNSGNSEGYHLHFDIYMKNDEGDYPRIKSDDFYDDLTTF